LIGNHALGGNLSPAAITQKLQTVFRTLQLKMFLESTKNFRIFLSHEKNKMQNLGDFHNFFRQWLPGTGYRSCPFWWIIQLDIEDNSAPLKGEHIFSQAHTFMTTTL